MAPRARVATQQGAATQDDGTSARAEEARAADLAYRELVDRLVTREIQPGGRIGVDATSRELGVSQTPVREALSRLESESLVTRVHLAGFRAAPLLTREEFDDLFEARMLLEPFLAQRAADKRSTQSVSAMLASQERMRAQADEIELMAYGDFASEDSLLHETISAAAGNKPLEEALRRLHAHVHLFRLHYDAGVPRDAIAEHDDIIQAIVDQRPQQAARAMKAHLRRSKTRLQTAFL